MSEFRESCPSCGAEVHRVAGRCRHCKVDLVALRTAQAEPTAAPRVVVKTPRPRSTTLWALAVVLLVSLGLGVAIERWAHPRPAVAAGPQA